jgi:hypothetical protein
VSSGVFDLEAGHITITLPDPGKRFQSILVVDEDHYNPIADFRSGTYRLTRQDVGTRYVLVALRTFVDPTNPEDVKKAHTLQDSVKVDVPGGEGNFVIPPWDTESQNTIRDSLAVVGRSLTDFKGAFGKKKEVDPQKHLIGAALGWGGNPDSVAVYRNVYPPQNDGKTNYILHVPSKVPVNAFWSISVYNSKGYFEKNPYAAYNLNSVTSKKNKDGSVDIFFGGCDGKKSNCLPIVEGWNYTVRLYRPHKEILDGTWKFPDPQPVK